jgi:GntR family transcriptional repressor for pyruvate dehydrogenase complex
MANRSTGQTNSTPSTDVGALIKEIRPERLYSLVVRQMLDLISSGQVTVGQRLPAERELALRFGVSRASIRQALTALEVLGVVHVRAGSGVYVGEHPGPHLVGMADSLTAAAGPLEILESRLLFEPGVAALATARRTPADLKNIEAQVAAMADQLNLGLDGWEPDIGFHDAVARATHNPSVQTIARLLHDQMTQPLWALMRSRNLRRAHHARRYLGHHSHIYDAIASGDEAAAERLMRSHIEAVMSDLGEPSMKAGEGGGVR